MPCTLAHFGKSAGLCAPGPTRRMPPEGRSRCERKTSTEVFRLTAPGRISTSFDQIGASAVTVTVIVCAFSMLDVEGSLSWNHRFLMVFRAMLVID